MHPNTLKVRLEVALIATAVVKFTPTPSRMAAEYNTGLCAIRDKPDPNSASCSKKAAEIISQETCRWTQIHKDLNSIVLQLAQQQLNEHHPDRLK